MKCIGCGVKLQALDPEKEGYVSEIHMIENGEEVYCKRCYDIIHYNKRYIPNTDNDINEISLNSPLGMSLYKSKIGSTVNYLVGKNEFTVSILSKIAN